MDIKALILKILAKNKEIKVADIIAVTGFSRAYINRFLKELRDEGKIILIGRANKARYVKSGKKLTPVLEINRILKNTNLSEDLVLNDIKRDSDIFLNLPKNISTILDYVFTEMLNNAIVHSQSEKIEITMKKNDTQVRFEVRDRGVGIFKNIMEKNSLKNELAAIQDLLKGKQTTIPTEHTGEGIFFTSKVADILTIQSSIKKLMFDNILNDIFIKDVKNTIGTKVNFTISIKSKTELSRVFRKYTTDAFSFSKTKVDVRLYKMGTNLISRSQARRIVNGLDKFKTIILDFKGVETVGQAFADELFRIWQKYHLDINIQYQNANENIDFMIKRAKAAK